jgi:hypothetical protein
MTQRKLIVLTALVVALFAFVYFFERKMPTTEERVKKGDLVWELPEDHIEAIRLERPAGMVELARTGPTSWRLVKPDSYPADTAAVTELLSQLARLRRAGGDAAEAKPDDYGFKTPSAKATVTWKDDAKPGKKLSRTLELGIEIPGTETTAGRVAGGNAVFFVSTNVAMSVKKTPDEFKTKEVFPSAPEAARLDVDRGRGHLSFAKKDAAWWLRQPLSDLAETGAVDKLIASLTALKALEFIPSSQGQGLASLGLAPPLFHIVLADAKTPGTSVDIGATRSDGNAVYARRENQVFTVASTIVEDLSHEAEAFREPHLLRFDRAAVTGIDGAFASGKFAIVRKDGGWSLSGRPLVAPSVDDLLTAILDVRSKAFGDDAMAAALASREPAATVVLKLSAGEPWTVRIYPGGTEARATVSGRPGAFLIAGEPVAPLEAAFQKAAAPPPATSPTIPVAPPKKERSKV